jgi:hypothetical protein
MAWLRRGDWLSSPAGQLAQQNRRAQRRLMFSINGIEPRAKNSMSEADKDGVRASFWHPWLPSVETPFAGR